MIRTDRYLRKTGPETERLVGMVPSSCDADWQGRAYNSTWKLAVARMSPLEEPILMS